MDLLVHDVVCTLLWYTGCALAVLAHRQRYKVQPSCLQTLSHQVTSTVRVDRKPFKLARCKIHAANAKTIFRNLAACQTASAASPHLSNLALPSLPPSCSFFLLSSSNTVFILSCKGPAHSCVQEIQVLDSFHQLSSIAPRLTQIKPLVSLSAASNSVADFIAISNTSVVTSLSSTRPQFLLSLVVKESGSSLLRLKLNNYFFFSFF